MPLQVGDLYTVALNAQREEEGSHRRGIAATAMPEQHLRVAIRSSPEWVMPAAFNELQFASGNRQLKLFG